MQTPGGGVPLELELTSQHELWKGSLVFPKRDNEPIDIENIELNHDSLSFPLPEKAPISGRSVLFKGVIDNKNNRIKGTIHRYHAYFYRGDISHPVILARAGTNQARELHTRIGPSCASPAEEPMNVKLSTTDITHFWDAYDKAEPNFEGEAFDTLYFSKASSGLRDFILSRMKNADRFAKQVRSHARYYASTRESTQQVSQLKSEIRAAFFAMEYLYPEASYPNVYFLMGRMNTGGTISHCGLLIGAEMYGRTSETPVDELSDWQKNNISSVDHIPSTVAHELAHYQQDTAPTQTLLQESIYEGTADFMAYLLTGRPINGEAYDWAEQHEAQLWKEFTVDMNNKDFGAWLYGDAGDRPSDLGYWIGFQIVQAYYQQADDKHKAIEDILTIQDFEAFLGKSGYDGGKIN